MSCENSHLGGESSSLVLGRCRRPLRRLYEGLHGGLFEPPVVSRLHGLLGSPLANDVVMAARQK